MFLDFFNLYLVSLYVYHYRNPVLFKSVHKVFWRFPGNYETKDNWSRIDKDVKRQIIWLHDPRPLENSCYDEIRSEMNSSQLEIAKKQFNLAKEYDRLRSLDYDCILVNYIDLKEHDIFSYDQMKKTKKHFK